MSDQVFDGWVEWLNEALFTNKDDEDIIVWLGGTRWLVCEVAAPEEMFVVEIHKAKVVRDL